MSSPPPTFRKQASVWSLSDTCFVIPQYSDSNADLIAPLVAQARAMLVSSDELQIVDTAKYIAGTTAATTTNCPTGDVPPPHDPIEDAVVVKCQTQPPYNDSLPKRMTVVSSGASPLVPLTSSVEDFLATLDPGAGVWVLTAAGDNPRIYTVTFPPVPSSPLEPEEE